MLCLVLSDRNEICLIEKNIRCHEDRISEEADVDIVRMFRALILELGHTVHLAHICEAVENPCEFRMGRYMGLIVNAGFLRIYSCCYIEREQRTGTFSQHCRILSDCDRVLVDNTVKTHVLICERDPVLQGSEIISEREISCRLHA